MKKLLAMVLTLVMLAATGLCFAEAAEPACVEAWDLVAMFQDGVQMEEGNYPMLSFYLYDDGSVRSELRGRMNQEGTFEMIDDPTSYVITFGDQSATLVFDEESGFLYLENEANGQTGVFQLRADMPAELNAESIDEFQGTWRINAMINSGSLVHPDSAAGQEFLSNINATDAVVVIEGDKATFFGVLEGTCELVDGSLAVTTPSGEIMITLTEGDSIIVEILAENSMTSKMFADKE